MSSTARSTTSASSVETLEEAGHSFRSRGDAEVLPHLYEERGPDLSTSCAECSRSLSGTRSKQELLLARDRVGEKPLYYTDRLPGGGFAFASEMKALLAAGVSREPDHEALIEYLYYLYIPAPRSGFARSRSLSRLNCFAFAMAMSTSRALLVADIRACRIARTRNTSSGLRERVVDAVRSRLVADVPLGAFLSGGIDSASVVAAMRARMTGPFTPSRSRSRASSITTNRSKPERRQPTSKRSITSSEAEVDPTESFRRSSRLRRTLRERDRSAGEASPGRDSPTREGRADRRRRRRALLRLSALSGPPPSRSLPAPTPLALQDACRAASRLIPESTTGRHTARRVREFLAPGDASEGRVRVVDWLLHAEMRRSRCSFPRRPRQLSCHERSWTVL